ERDDVVRRESAFLHGRGGKAGDGLPVLLEDRGEVAHDEDALVARDTEVLLDEDAPRPIERHAEALRAGRAEDARRPEDGARRDLLRRGARAHGDAALVDPGHARPRAHLDAERRELAHGAPRELVVEAREEAVEALDEDDARLLGADPPEVAA